ncbi:MAG TPA: gluconate 2-dehydrogenase subunit 3 family protein [Sphingobacteriaceae bacterium]
MDRRDSLKALAIGSLSVGTLLSGCEGAKDEKAASNNEKYGRTPEETERDQKLLQEKFFTEAELGMIAILADIIIPADAHSGSATDAKVPEFIEFIAKDQPRLQTPLRGGLKWLDVQSLKRYGNTFAKSTAGERIQLVEDIAYPEKAAPDMGQGVAFFSLMRNLTASGFFTSRMGIEDLGYKGNTPNSWDGVPEEVLAQYGLEYDEKLLAQCLKNEDRGRIMTWES